MLEQEVKEQLKSVFAGLNSEYMLRASVPLLGAEDLLDMLHDVANCSGHIFVEEQDGDSLGFSLWKDGQPTGVSFKGIPGGHEFTSLLMAILNADNKGKNIPDTGIIERIKSLPAHIRLTTYVSLSCTVCPDVVQALNLMAILHGNLTHETVIGDQNEEEVTRMHVQAVPTVYANGELLHVGRADLGTLLNLLEARFPSHVPAGAKTTLFYDLLVLGGGPAGCAAAIYAARKGLKTAIVAEKIGGQVTETLAIENMISVPETTGSTLARDLKNHLSCYPIDCYEHRQAVCLRVDGKIKEIAVAGGECFAAPLLVVATGARWRRLNVPGEAEHVGRGVAFCAHCDGPFYKGKRVAVIGGGNTGIEAAIDLAGYCQQVLVFEFLNELRADTLLLEKVKKIPNVEIHTSSNTLEIIGTGEKVQGIRVENTQTKETRVWNTEGVFVQIGLVPNSRLLRDIVPLNARGEIEIDNHCRTKVPGIYAAGDVSSVPYKQIIIAMGEGAKSALAAFEDRTYLGDSE
jgi:alkyl hydroperoxide reductase subunit F